MTSRQLHSLPLAGGKDRGSAQPEAGSVTRTVPLDVSKLIQGILLHDKKLNTFKVALAPTLLGSLVQSITQVRHGAGRPTPVRSRPPRVVSRP